MPEIKCPKCGEVFQVDDSGYAAILKQVHDKEFQKEIERREREWKEEKEKEVELAVTKAEAKKDREITKKDREIARLEGQVELDKSKADRDIEIAVKSKENEILKLKSALDLEKSKRELSEKTLKEAHDAEIKCKDAEIAYYKDFKARQSTKMIGESLEQHCENEFNILRSTAFQNAYFEKDNDARSGSKGDFIYRESAPDGTEFISIMFEMKNEMDETKTKHNLTYSNTRN